MKHEAVRIRLGHEDIYFDNVLDRAALAAGGEQGLDVARVLGPIKALAKSLNTYLAELGPDEITIETSARVSGKLGLVFTTAAAESAFRVSFTWKAPPPKHSQLPEHRAK